MERLRELRDRLRADAELTFYGELWAVVLAAAIVVVGLFVLGFLIGTGL